LTVTSNGVPETYTPAAWLADTLSVAPTLIVCFPVASRTPVVAGTLVNALTNIVLAPEVTVVDDEGSVIA